MGAVPATVALLATTTIAHDGTEYAVGDLLRVTEAQAAALVQGKAATLAPAVEAVAQAVAAETAVDGTVADAATDAEPAAKTKAKK